MDHPSNPAYPHSEYFVPFVDFNESVGWRKQIRLARDLLYSRQAKSLLNSLLEMERPDIAHINNIAHQISPSILHALKRHGIPVVCTMHDYKMVCPSYSLLYMGKPCEACNGGKYRHCAFKKCVKGSTLKSVLNTLEMYLHHKVLHIYDIVDLYISPSLFMKRKLFEMGFKAPIAHLPNFVDPAEFRPQFNSDEASIIYFGRLSPEKGLYTLIDAVRHSDRVTLKIAGDGPIRTDIESRLSSENISNVKLLGYMSGDELRNEIRRSLAVVLASECFDNNPLSVIEGFALGKSVIGARIGGIPELVKDGITGFTFEAGNAEELRQKIELLVSNPDISSSMGKNARVFVERELNPEKYYHALLELYHFVLRYGIRRVGQPRMAQRIFQS
jgi:glycosyltransferase involved in cell wall biosynthesis